ncbi:hypothetical protein [Epilithonimonas sp.]|uniref:hypothetical protein n=1 Tax=Epilithonimonas sp. TaxID=2894511 RepID=UPI0035AE28EA
MKTLIIILTKIPDYRTDADEGANYFFTSAEFERALLMGIFILLGLIFILSVSYVIVVYKRIRRVEKTIFFEPGIFNYLERITNEKIRIEKIALEFHNDPYKNDKIFIRMITKSIIDAHNYFRGNMKLRLENFYLSTGLLHHSHKKLKSNRWYIKCKGLRELSEMEVIYFYKDVLKLCYEKNNLVNVEAILGIIKMKGSEAYKDVSGYRYPLSKWVIANIIESIKGVQNNRQFDYSLMLNSKNESILMIGIEMIKYFNLRNYEEELNYLRAVNKSPDIQKMLN